MRFYKALLWKAYFDKGYGLTNYFKYLLLAFGWATDDVKTTIAVGTLWAFSCLIIGRVWFHYKLIETENEVNNNFNPFQVEVRQAIKNKRFI